VPIIGGFTCHYRGVRCPYKGFRSLLHTGPCHLGAVVVLAGLHPRRPCAHAIAPQVEFESKI